MTITNDAFEAFLRCPTKCFLRADGALPSGNVFADWVREDVESYRLETTTRLTKRLSPVVPFSGSLRDTDFISADWRWAVDATVRSQNLEIRLHAIERIASSPGPAQLVPIRFVRAKKPNSVDKLMLAFDSPSTARTPSSLVPRRVATGCPKNSKKNNSLFNAL